MLGEWCKRFDRLSILLAKPKTNKEEIERLDLFAPFLILVQPLNRFNKFEVRLPKVVGKEKNV